MRKKLLSLLLTLAMLLSLCPAALAAEDGGDIRETDFFTDQTHTELNFDEMEYQAVDGDQFVADIEALQELAADKANAEAVEEGFYSLMDRYLNMVTMYRLANIKTSQNVNDKEAETNFADIAKVLDKVADALSLMMQALLAAPCGEFLQDVLTEEDIEYYTNYTPTTEEQFALSEQETALEAEFNRANNQTFTYEHEGVEWDDDSIYDAYSAGQVDEETYTLVSRAIAQSKNAALGEIFIRLVELRQDIAKSYGYDNYLEYAYAEIYQRDFAPEEAQAFHQSVKDGGYYDIYSALRTLVISELNTNQDVYYGDFAGDIALDMMEPYVGQISSELLEAFTYMREHGFIDSGADSNKDGSGFTTILDAYGAPFYFNTPYGFVGDFTTAIHEFGHYNNYYWQPCGWNDGSKTIDLAECHSQGLELLFAHFYPEIFGESGQFVLDFQLMSMLSAISDGALYDELQQYVYTTEDITLEQINQKYRQLCGEYGMVEEDDPRTEMYSWVDVHHNFTAPCYYISYGVSAPVALEFYLDSLTDYEGAVDSYLQFTALPAEYSFQESLEETGRGNPLAEGYMAGLAEQLWTALDLEARLAAIPQPAELSFSDVTEANWFYQYVMLMASNGFVSGYEDGTFRPNEPAVWGLVDDDPASAEEVITRGEFCQVLLQTMGMEAETVEEAVAALVELGIIGGYPDGSLQSEAVMTRAEFCTAFVRFSSYAGQQGEDEAPAEGETEGEDEAPAEGETEGEDKAPAEGETEGEDKAPAEGEAA